MSVLPFPWPTRPLCQRASVVVVLAFCFGSSNALFSLTLLGHLCTKITRGRSESKEMASWTARLWAKTSFGYAETADNFRGENCRAGGIWVGIGMQAFWYTISCLKVKSVHVVASQRGNSSPANTFTLFQG
jgi:hypothetical protein